MRRPGIFAPPGTPSDPNLMLSWQPGAVTCYYDYLQVNNLFNYKAQNPATTIIVRFQHPKFWRQNPEQTAVAYGQHIAAKWNELRPLDPYVCFANELNLHIENGDLAPANQPLYETEDSYRLIGQWVTRTAQVIKDAAPQMRLITPPFAPGRHEDGSPNRSGHILEPFAGYDFLADAVKTYFDRTLAFHAYWGNGRGSRRDWLYDPDVSSWHAFRWRRLLRLFQTRYNLQARIIIDEATNFAAYDPTLFDQLTYYSRQTLADPRVVALTYFLWEDPTFNPRNLFATWTSYVLDLPGFAQRLAAQSDILIDPFIEFAESAPISPPQPPVDQFNGPVIRVGFEDGHVESMPLETYLRAVVPAEVPATWPAEALRAQAVAARTFAYQNLERAPYHDRPYDISASYKHAQQYNPARIHPNADQAILDTKGMILQHNNRTIQALFSAECGGHTRNNEDAPGFTKTPLPYLRGVPCPSPGPKRGHGVGLCQIGTQLLAAEGQTYEQILHHYYRDVTLHRLPYA